MDWIKLFTEFGLNGLIQGAVITLLFFVIKWTLETAKDILSQAAEERKCFYQTITDVSKAIDSHTSHAREFQANVNEAHKFQREEHKQMIEVLGRINGYKHN